MAARGGSTTWVRRVLKILIVSGDEDATAALRRALEHGGGAARFAVDADQARALARTALPYVLVVDSAVEGGLALIEELSVRAPWLRAFVTCERGEPPTLGPPAIFKPFDAAELSATLLREQQLAIVTEQRTRADDRAEELAQIVDLSLEAMIGVGLDGVIHAWNLSATRIYGYDAGDMIGLRLRALQGEDDAATPLAQAGLGPREVKRRRKGGAEINVIVSLQRVYDARGELRGFAELSLDVTAMRKLQLEMEHVERLATVGRLAAALAHDINNGLTTIDASVDFAKERAVANGDQELAEAMADARAGSRAIAAFVRHVCGFTRREPTPLASLPLAETLKMAARLVRARAASRGIALDVQTACDVVAMLDPTRFAQALVNLLSNAIDVAGSRVTMRVLEGPERTEVRVEDDGPGISPSMVVCAFEPFVTTKPLGEGTGLGLAIVRQIVDDHGGTVHLARRAEGGTAAVVTLPKHQLR